MGLEPSERKEISQWLDRKESAMASGVHTWGSALTGALGEPSKRADR
jgi:hypothetical protein